jgi:hypothetical protein
MMTEERRLKLLGRLHRAIRRSEAKAGIGTGSAVLNFVEGTPEAARYYALPAVRRLTAVAKRWADWVVRERTA